MKAKMPRKLSTLPAAQQRRLDALLEKNSEGTITTAEKVKLTRLVAEAERIMAANAQRLADFAQRNSPSVPANAVPVTVWVQPQAVEQ